MHPQTTLLAAAVVTLGAAEWFFTSVNAYMSLQALCIQERLITPFTR